MATITSDTFLDGGVARTAGEAWTMNGAILTVRTDTRWHADAPASMTGSIGSTSISSTLGGGVLFDARNVRWMPYDTGSGNVPAIGTTITQGGVSGYLLGVWAGLNVAPTAVGGGMPPTGFLKFREVTGGAFSAGALTGIGASSTEPDVVGWIEVVQRQLATNTVPRLGAFRTRGNWFEIGTTSGTAGQIFQVPTNGGGVGTHVPSIWVETGVGTDVYEAYPCILSAHFIPGNLSTDARSKIAETMGDGQVRIGNNGTNDVGFLPPVGCRVRIPNILGRQSTAAEGDANNLVPFSPTLSTRPRWVTTSAGAIDFEFFMDDWYHLFATPYHVRHVNCATFDIHSTSNEASPTELTNYVTGAYKGADVSLILAANPLGGEITDCKFFRQGAATNGHACTVTTSADYTFTRCHFGVITFARSTGRAVATSQCVNLMFEDCYQYNAYTQHTTSFGIRHLGLDHCDRFVGATTTATGMYGVAVLTSSDNIYVDGFTCGLKGTIPNVNPYLSFFYSINSSNVTFRNAGTRTNPISVASAALGPQYLVHDAGVNTNLLAQRIYAEFSRTSVLLTVNTSKNSRFESLHGTVGAIQLLSLNTQVKGIRATSNSVTGGASVYGTHFFDMFTSDTTGVLVFPMNEPTAFSEGFVSLTLAGSLGGFTSGGQVSMPTVGDELLIEIPYFILGVTAFANAAATLTGTGTANFSYEYDLDKGSGFSGTYQTVSGANLFAETINPAIGFKMRLRITCTNGVNTNAITYVRINTVSTLAAQTDYLYPLDLAPINLSGFISGTRIQIYNVTDAVEVYNDVPVGTSLSISEPYLSPKTFRVRAMYANGMDAKMFVEFEEVFTSTGFAEDILQTDDLVYIANAIDGSTVPDIEIEDGALLVNVNTGSLTWQALYAYETHWLQTEEGIRDEQRFIRAVDQANYVLEAFKIKNVTSPSIPLVISNGYGVDSLTGNAIDIIDISGGTIFNAPDRVVPFATGGGGGGDSKEDTYTYFTTSGRQDAFKADVSGIESDLTVIKADVSAIESDSKEDTYTYFTTANRQDTFKAESDSKEDTYTYFTTSGRQDAFKADVSGIESDSKEDTYTYFTTSGRQDAFKADVSGIESDLTIIKDDLTGVESNLAELESDLATINTGVKKASLLIPHTEDL